MDMNELRRSIMGRVLAAMASGAQFVKGTFTVPSTGPNYTINFGKAFSKYLYIIEMTDESKADLISTEINAARTIAMIGIYPSMVVDNAEAYSDLLSRINPSTKALTVYQMTNLTKDSSSLTITIGTTGNANTLYYDYSYNYYIVEIK